VEDDLDREPATSQPASRQPASRVTPEAAATARALLDSTASEAGQQTGAGNWSVQVNATQERGVADRLVSDLRARGYDAFIVTQTREGAVWYRVRVGRLASLEKANALVGELKERAGLSHAFVASD
jgi:cell division septation protein DedD